MRYVKAKWVSAIVLTVGLLTTGCADLHTNRQQLSETEAPAKAESVWGNALRAPGKKKDSLFFNEKSREIEESLGL